jgi:hypothetical protein
MLAIFGYCIGNQKEDHTMYMKYGRLSLNGSEITLSPFSKEEILPTVTITLGFFLGVKTRVVVCRGSNNALPNRRRVWTRILCDTVQIGS